MNGSNPPLTPPERGTGGAYMRNGRIGRNGTIEIKRHLTPLLGGAGGGFLLGGLGGGFEGYGESEAVRIVRILSMSQYPDLI